MNPLKDYIGGACCGLGSEGKKVFYVWKFRQFVTLFGYNADCCQFINANKS